MASSIRRLQMGDRATHGARPAQVVPAEAPPVAEAAADDPLTLLQTMGQDRVPAAPQGGEGAALVERTPPVDAGPVPDLDVPAASAPEQAPPVQEEEGGEAADRVEVSRDATMHQDVPAAARCDVLDILAAMSPVFRAASVYPGVDATPAQIEEAIRQMSRSAAQLADAVARETDELEIDLRWRRRRATVFTADLVASCWLSAVIRQGGGAFDGISLNEAMPRLARGVQGALGIVREQPLQADAGWSPSAAVFALAPLVLDLQRYADVIQSALPGFVVEIDAAASAIGAVAGEEVRRGVERIAALVPEPMQIGLASELMAHVGAMALAAWELVRGGVLGQLQGAADAQAGLAILTGPGMSGGVPVPDIVDRLRPMLRRLVGTTEYAAREMLAVQARA